MSNRDATEVLPAHKPTKWTVRENLGSVEAMKKYDQYITEHRRRLRQLEKEARGEMTPSDEWYTE